MFKAQNKKLKIRILEVLLHESFEIISLLINYHGWELTMNISHLIYKNESQVLLSSQIFSEPEVAWAIESKKEENITSF